MEDKKRSFTVYGSDVNFKGGRYMSLNPGSAAKKAASRIFRDHSKKSVIVLTLRETTSGSKHDHYSYRATKVLLDKPFVAKIGNKEIEYKFKIEVKAIEVEKSHHTAEKKPKAKKTMKKGGNEFEKPALEDFINNPNLDKLKPSQRMINVSSYDTHKYNSKGGSCNSNYCTI